MTMHGIISIDEAKTHFSDAKIGDCICWKIFDNGDGFPSDTIPFGIGSNIEDAFANGANIELKIDVIEEEGHTEGIYTYSFVANDGSANKQLS